MQEKFHSAQSELQLASLNCSAIASISYTEVIELNCIAQLDCLLVLLGVSSTEVKWSIEGGGKCTNRSAENPLAEKTTCYVRIELHEKFQTASQLLIPDACLVLLDVAIHSWRLSYDINKEQNKIFLD